MIVKQYTLSRIAAELDDEVYGEDVSVCVMRPLAQVDVEYTGFLIDPEHKYEVYDSKAGTVIVSDRAAEEFAGRSLIVAADPYLCFARVARLFSPVIRARGGVHPTAVVESSTTVPGSCETGANAYIGANIVLSEDCRILANAVAQYDCRLGGEVVLHPSAVVYYGCTLGNHVEIHSGTVIGANGFGLAFVGDSQFKVPQAGAVTLGDDMEIGPNSNVDRGAMNDTTVDNDTRIDNQVRIGHNCKISSHTIIAAKTGISDSVTIGSYCIIGGRIGIVSHAEIIDETTIDGDTSVTRSITENGQHVVGAFPMSSYKEQARSVVHIHRLNETGKRIKRLEQELVGLKNGKQTV